jgi:hypothetical protein
LSLSLSFTASLVSAETSSDESVGALSSVCVTRIGGASNSIVTSFRDVCANSVEANCNIARSVGRAVAWWWWWWWRKAGKSISVGSDWNNIATLGDRVVDGLLALVCEILGKIFCLAAIGISTEASSYKGVNTLSSVDIARVLGASNSIIARNRCFNTRRCSIISNNTLCSFTTVTWNTSLLAWRWWWKTVVVEGSRNWDDLAGLSGWVVHSSLAGVEVVCSCKSGTALVVSAFASSLEGVNTSSSLGVARISSARDSIVTIGWSILANISICSSDTSCRFASISWFTSGSARWWRRRRANKTIVILLLNQEASIRSSAIDSGEAIVVSVRLSPLLTARVGVALAVSKFVHALSVCRVASSNGASISIVASDGAHLASISSVTIDTHCGLARVCRSAVEVAQTL